MNRARRWLTVAAFTMLSVAAVADPAADRNEIDGLLWRIEQSSCRFLRNGSDYSGQDAAKHLRAKWQIAEKRSQSALTAEQFITQVASVSSLSGRPYGVDCPGDGQGTLNAWLNEALKSLRVAGPRS